MKATLNINELRERLEHRGFSDAQIAEMMEEVIAGLDVKLNPSTFEFNAGNHCEIYMLSPRGDTPQDGDILKTYNFVTDIEGIEDTQIKSIRIPELNSSSNEVFELDITFLPFRLSGINLNK